MGNISVNGNTTSLTYEMGLDRDRLYDGALFLNEGIRSPSVVLPTFAMDGYRDTLTRLD